ncbi:MAG: hypothetical protein Q9195_002581 [Heterodermia aff. obscurata]
MYEEGVWLTANRATQQTRADLIAALAPKDLIYNDLNEYVMRCVRLHRRAEGDTDVFRYRISCESLLLNDFEFALGYEVEQKLWDAHVKINKRYQKMLSLTRTSEGKKTPVEYRKTAKRYLDFIKASQRFYRVYIKRLASRFGGVPQLDAIAYSLRLDTSSEEATTEPSQTLGRAILLSCHQTLVRLGDLSRYRETELSGDKSNWGPAIGYYDLAGTVYPPSGVSHNQLAVIAKCREHHLSAIYHLYRALAAEESHPMAKGNLELEFRKIEAAWTKAESISSRVAEKPQQPGTVLENLFMRLHALCYKGSEFAEHDELENEVLSQIAVELKERPLESFLNKIVLINITAQFSASEDFQSPPHPPAKMQALLFFLRLNVRTFFTLLQLLQSELELGASSDVDPYSAHGLGRSSNRMTAVARRLLPSLRQYSSWLTVNLSLLVNKVGDNVLEVQVREMWKTYANTLTIIASTFEIAELPSVEYLLEEDEDTICYKPFKDDTSPRYRPSGSTDMKPMFHTQGVERQHPNVDMLGRIGDFLRVGVELAMEIEDVPIDYQTQTGTFVYREEGVPSELLASPAGQQATLSSTTILREEIPHTNGSKRVDEASMADGQGSHAPSVSMGTSAENWVNNLLEGESTGLSAEKGRIEDEKIDKDQRYDISRAVGNETSYGSIGSITAADLVRDIRSFSTPQASPRPRLPSIYNSPFAPLADEEAPLSRRSTEKFVTPNHSQQNSLQGFVGNFSPSNVQQGFATFSQLPNGYHHHQVDSSMSSIGAPSSIGYSQSFPRTHLTTHSPRNYPINYEDSNFMSSNLFSGSVWNETGKQAGMVPTPPNGQQDIYGG